MRDTFATLLLMANVSLTYISEQLGHKDPSVAVEHYARWLPGSNRAAMDVLPGADELVPKRQLEVSIMNPTGFRVCAQAGTGSVDSDA